MPDWLKYLKLVQTQAARVPMLGWAVAGVVVVSLAVMFFMEMAGPPYVALYDGLSPADGGKVIAQLQKLSIPYQLEAAGNIILVPAPLLASARLQMGAAQVPQTDTSAAWEKVEDAPMTASDLAQNTMATQALEGTLAQSINGINGISNAQVFIAVPPDTPFLADQPKTTASVQIDADAAAAAAQGPAIAALVAGAVPGLAAASVSVETTSGISVYPVYKQAQTGAQLAIIAQV